MITNFNKYKMNEKDDNELDPLDPYGEELDDDDEGKKKERIEKCLDLVDSDHWNFRHWIRDVLRKEFERYGIDDLKDFCGGDEE